MIKIQANTDKIKEVEQRLLELEKINALLIEENKKLKSEKLNITLN